MTEAEIDKQAKIVWDYLQLHEEPRKCDAVFVLCSIDELIFGWVRPVADFFGWVW